MAKWGSVDFQSLVDLRDRLEEAEKQSGDLCEKCAKELAARLLRKVIKLTPVKTGELRRNWFATKVKRVGNAFEVTVYNPKEYAPYVEWGHRQEPGRFVPAIGKKLVEPWVEGRYMLTKSELELEKQAPGLLAKMVQKYLEEMLNGK